MAIRTEDLTSTLRGRVILPGDGDYDEARALRYGGMDRRPAAIAQVVDAKDAAQVVSFARDAGLPLAVHGGGHSLMGASMIDDSIVLDLRAMQSCDIDPEDRTAWVDAGMSAGAFTTAAHEHELAVGFGDAGTVSVGGITVGGGVGFLVRKDGLTIDSLLAAEIVTADAQILHVDQESHPDLFWAIRGGGGNFGVVTRLRFRLQPVGTIVGGMLLLPATADTVAGFITAAQAAPEELSTIANVMPAPAMPFIPPEHVGRLVIVGLLVHAGEIEAGERAVAPFRSLATPLADMVTAMPYPGMYPPEEPPRLTATGRTMFVDGFDRSLAETIVARLEAVTQTLPSPASMRVTQLRVLGGAMARVPTEGTAFAHRHREMMVNVGAVLAPDEELAAADAWAEDLASTIRGDDPTGYVNFLGDVEPERVRAAYPGQTWDRLRAIKASYDPANLFRHNQNIPPGR